MERNINKTLILCPMLANPALLLCTMVSSTTTIRLAVPLRPQTFSRAPVYCFPRVLLSESCACFELYVLRIVRASAEDSSHTEDPPFQEVPLLEHALVLAVSHVRR